MNKNNIRRRDNKGRILRNGETQRSDGRYVFKYVDNTGNPQFVYSWKLEARDKMPMGKRKDISLREKEKQIRKDLDDGIKSKDSNITVLELVERYLALQTGSRHNTEANYKTVVNILKTETFGKRRINRIKQSDAKLFFVKMQKENGRGYSSICSIRGVLRPAFQMAVDDDLIRKNPFSFALTGVVVNDSVKREAISMEDEDRFLSFVKTDEHFSRYYEGIYILFKTGIRISEFTGLTIHDLDMHNRIISIDHQLQRKRDGTKYIEKTKTNAGTRKIPMTDEVYECFKTILANRNVPSIEPIIDGYSGFLYFDRFQKPMVSMHWEKYFQHICEKYNNSHKTKLPKITPHICRHTYCSIMAKNGINPKTLQYLMGHSDISVTLNTYTHVGLQDAIEELKRIEGV